MSIINRFRSNPFSSLLALAIGLAAGTLIVGCGEKQTQEQKVQAQLSSVHALTDVERPLADANAKKFFEQTWAPAGGQRGQFIACRPSDSNANGLVTCTGFIPQPGGGFQEVKRYCGYRPELVGCSDEDTVKP